MVDAYDHTDNKHDDKFFTNNSIDSMTPQPIFICSSKHFKEGQCEHVFVLKDGVFSILLNDLLPPQNIIWREDKVHVDDNDGHQMVVEETMILPDMIAGNWVPSRVADLFGTHCTEPQGIEKSLLNKY